MLATNGSTTRKPPSQILAYIASQIGASSSNTLQKQKLISDLLPLVQSVPIAHECTPTDFAPLSYLLHTCMQLTDCKSEPFSLRLDASRIMLTLCQRYPGDAFVESILPGSVAACVRMLEGMDVERDDLVASICRYLGVLLGRGWRRAQKENKLFPILNHLEHLAISHTPTKDCFLKMLQGLLKINTDDLAWIKGVIRVICLCTKKSDLKGDVRLEQIAFEMASEIIKSLMESFLAREWTKTQLTVKQFQILNALIQMIPEVKAIDDLHHLIQMQIREFLIEDAFLTWRRHFTGKSGGDLMEQILNLVKLAHSPLSSSSSSLASMTSMAEDTDRRTSLLMPVGCLITTVADDCGVLLEYFDYFCTRPLCPDDTRASSSLVDDEDLWMFSWCDAVGRHLDCDPDVASLEYFVLPLLTLDASLNLAIKDMAQSVFERIATFLGTTPKTLLRDNGRNLLNRICGQIRLSAIYPKSPMTLKHFLVAVGDEIDALTLADVVGELIESAALWQSNHPAFIQSLLQSMRSVVRVASWTRTLRPKKPTESDESKAVSVEEELVDKIARLAVNFITDDHDGVRLSALEVLLDVPGAFQHPDSKDILLPLTHHCWGALLQRLAKHDPNTLVIQQSLLVIGAFAKVAGSFMRDRIQKELFPLLPSILARPSFGHQPQLLSQMTGAIVSLIEAVGGVKGKEFRHTCYAVIAICGVASNMAIMEMMQALHRINANVLWYILAVELSATDHNDHCDHSEKDPQSKNNDSKWSLYRNETVYQRLTDQQKTIIGHVYKQLYPQ